jgi:hypothetical protein
MPVQKRIAQLIAESADELRKAIGSPFDPTQPLDKQAANLLSTKTILKSVAKRISIPKKDELPKHLDVEFNPFLES